MLYLWGQTQTNMNEERQRLVLKQQRRFGELLLVFPNPDEPYLGVVDEIVPQGMPEKGKNGFKLLAENLTVKLKPAKKLRK